MRPTEVCQVLILGFQVVGFFLHQVSQLPVVPLDLLLLLLMPLSPAIMLLVLFFNPQQPLCVCENSSRCYPLEKELGGACKKSLRKALLIFMENKIYGSLKQKTLLNY